MKKKKNVASRCPAQPTGEELISLELTTTARYTSTTTRSGASRQLPQQNRATLPPPPLASTAADSHSSEATPLTTGAKEISLFKTLSGETSSPEESPHSEMAAVPVILLDTDSDDVPMLSPQTINNIMPVSQENLNLLCTMANDIPTTDTQDDYNDGMSDSPLDSEEEALLLGDDVPNPMATDPLHLDTQTLPAFTHGNAIALSPSPALALQIAQSNAAVKLGTLGTSPAARNATPPPKLNRAITRTIRNKPVKTVKIPVIRDLPAEATAPWTFTPTPKPDVLPATAPAPAIGIALPTVPLPNREARRVAKQQSDAIIAQKATVHTNTDTVCHPLVAPDPYPAPLMTMTDQKSISSTLKRQKMQLESDQEARRVADVLTRQANLDRKADSDRQKADIAAKQAHFVRDQSEQNKNLLLAQKEALARQAKATALKPTQTVPTKESSPPLPAPGKDTRIIPSSAPLNCATAISLPAPGLDTVINSVLVRFVDIGAKADNTQARRFLFPKRQTLGELVNRVRPDCTYLGQEAFNSYLLRILTTEPRFWNTMHKDGIMSSVSIVTYPWFETNTPTLWLSASEARLEPHRLKIRNATPREKLATCEISIRCDYDGARSFFEVESTEGRNRMAQCHKHLIMHKDSATVQLAQCLNGMDPAIKKVAPMPPRPDPSAPPLLSNGQQPDDPRDSEHRRPTLRPPPDLDTPPRLMDVNPARSRDPSRNRRDLSSRTAPVSHQDHLDDGHGPWQVQHTRQSSTREQQRARRT
jgi:hypothetical protein